ncbi:MAG: shikimate dehydrogenase [Candidatus Bathyarchaeota archaeon]|nr:shikimate dehydrogenase [Candidatus Bathyarchaeota archaeon]
MNFTGKTRLYGVIGDPIEHSLSPALQNAAFHALQLDSVFLAFKVAPNQVSEALNGMRALNLGGLNVTMPHKNAVIPCLDEVDATAEFLGSVNTIRNEAGRLKGFSTDGEGAKRALLENGVELDGKKVVLLGGGGATKAIAYELAKVVDQLVVLNRTAQKAQAIAQNITNASGKQITANSLTNSSIKTALQDAHILINATSIGMHPNPNQTPVPPEILRSDLAVMDIVYNPVETQLAKAAKAAGAKVVSGVEMLLYQGAAAFEIWTGKTAPVEVMRQAAYLQLNSR